MSEEFFVFPGPVTIGPAPENASLLSHDRGFRIEGLRTPYIEKGCSGVIETLALTLRLFYPLSGDFDVFAIPEGTYVVNIGATRVPYKNAKNETLYTSNQLATLYSANGGELWRTFKISTSNNEHFLVPILEDNVRYEEDALMQQILNSSHLKNPTAFPIQRNGMPYFFNISMIWLLSDIRLLRSPEKRVVLRVQDAIYGEVAYRASSVFGTLLRLPSLYNPNQYPLYFTLCYVLWVSIAVSYDISEERLKENIVPAMERYQKQSIMQENVRNIISSLERYLTTME